MHLQASAIQYGSPASPPTSTGRVSDLISPQTQTYHPPETLPDGFRLLVTRDFDVGYFLDLSGLSRPVSIRSKLYARLGINEEAYDQWKIFRFRGSGITRYALDDSQIWELCLKSFQHALLLVLVLVPTYHHSNPNESLPSLNRSPYTSDLTRRPRTSSSSLATSNHSSGPRSPVSRPDRHFNTYRDLMLGCTPQSPSQYGFSSQYSHDQTRPSTVNRAKISTLPKLHPITQRYSQEESGLPNQSPGGFSDPNRFSDPDVDQSHRASPIPTGRDVRFQSSPLTSASTSTPSLAAVLPTVLNTSLSSSHLLKKSTHENENPPNQQRSSFPVPLQAEKAAQGAHPQSLPSTPSHGLPISAGPSKRLEPITLTEERSSRVETTGSHLHITDADIQGHPILSNDLQPSSAPWMDVVKGVISYIFLARLVANFFYRIYKWHQ